MKHSGTETLVDVWQIARAKPSFGDDIAQQAVVHTLERRNKGVREAAYFLETCRWLRVHGYSDQTGERRTDRLRHKLEVRMGDDTPEGVDTATPEMLALLKEKLEGLDKTTNWALSAKYSPLSDPETCSRGHTGHVHFIKRKNGTPQKACRLCNSMRQGRYRQQKRARRTA